MKFYNKLKLGVLEVQSYITNYLPLKFNLLVNIFIKKINLPT
jgi:hypothetical protein